MPAISVIVPVYKVEMYLHRCVESILSQTYKDFELILVDDGSPDNCGAICEEYAKRDSRIIVIHQENGGLSAARNAGIDWAFTNSNSDWLFFVDSDDFIHPMTLQSLLNASAQHDVDISIGGYQRTSGDAPIVDSASLIGVLWNTEDFFIQHNINAVVAWGKLYRKALFQGIRYPVGKIHEDEFTTHKLLFQCEQVTVISQPLYGYYENESSIMESTWNPKRLALLDALKEKITFFEQRKSFTLRDFSIRLLANSLAYLIHKNAGLAKDYPAIRRKLRRYLRFVLLRYKKCFSFISDTWLFDTAYPHASFRLRKLAILFRHR